MSIPRQSENSQLGRRRYTQRALTYLLSMTDVLLALTLLMSMCGASLILLYRAYGAL